MYGRGKKLSKPKIQNRNRYILKKKKKKKKLKTEYLKILEPFLKQKKKKKRKKLERKKN